MQSLLAIVVEADSAPCGLVSGSLDGQLCAGSVGVVKHDRSTGFVFGDDSCDEVEGQLERLSLSFGCEASVDVLEGLNVLNVDSVREDSHLVIFFLCFEDQVVHLFLPLSFL